MPTSVWSPEVRRVVRGAGERRETRVTVDGREVVVPRPFPSPTDWRDVWIYQIMIDRFCNPQAEPRQPPWDGLFFGFQGGTFEGVRRQLGYLQRLGVGALWLCPVQKNCQYQESYHGYGIQDFLALEPRFASEPARVETEFETLVTEAHARGIFVILDIVLNHAGDLFAYDGHGSEAPWRPTPYPIAWRDEQGVGREEWREPPSDPHPDAAVWPTELRANRFFRRQGRGGELGGDFASLKELVTDAREWSSTHGDHFPVRDALIRAHQYLIARYDVDGFRVDTLKYIEPEFARIFANAVRELALSIGKQNFFYLRRGLRQRGANHALHRARCPRDRRTDRCGRGAGFPPLLRVAVGREGAGAPDGGRPRLRAPQGGTAWPC